MFADIYKMKLVDDFAYEVEGVVSSIKPVDLSLKQKFLQNWTAPATHNHPANKKETGWMEREQNLFGKTH